MRKKTLVLCLLAALALPALAAADTPSLDQDLLQKAAERACDRVERNLLGFEGECVASDLERRVLAGEVVEYTWRLSVGAGPYDAIQLHRVVRETAPFQPIRTEKAVLLAHGDIWGFGAAFLSGGAQSLPIYLAQNGVDVWGVDFGWTLVPAAETDFAFLQTWGLERDARDLGIALTVARATRLFLGDGFAPIHLLAWSRGGHIGYVYLNGESQLPPGQRNVAGFIPVDIYWKTDVEDFRQKGCLRAAAGQAQLDAGVYQSATGQLIQAIGFLALTAPDDPSPIFAGFTNRQVALLTGAATYLLQGGLEPVPFYHFTGGAFDATGTPTGLLYSPEPALLSLLVGASPYQPNRELVDADLAICNEVDVPFDDHLDEITVPVLYVGAGGGFGESGLYTTTLLGSEDVTSLIVTLTPPEQRLFDFGHADLFLASQAETLVWQPLLAWLQAH